jgi:hypothetical protein
VERLIVALEVLTHMDQHLAEAVAATDATIKLQERDDFVSIQDQLNGESKEPVVLVNAFHVPPEQTDAVISAWSEDAPYFKAAGRTLDQNGLEQTQKLLTFGTSASRGDSRSMSGTTARAVKAAEPAAQTGPAASPSHPYSTGASALDPRVPV